MQWFTGTDVVPEFFDQIAQRAAVRESSPPATPNRVMREDALAAVVVDKPDLASLIDFHAGVVIYGLAVEEPATMVGNDSDRLVDVLDALALQSEFVFCGHGDTSALYSRVKKMGQGNVGKSFPLHRCRSREGNLRKLRTLADGFKVSK